MTFMPLLFLHHDPDNPILPVFNQDDVRVFGVERVKDPGVVVPFIRQESGI
jgi:hypothetical protein